MITRRATETEFKRITTDEYLPGMRQLLSMGVTILLILVIIYVSKDAIQGVLGVF